jgi:serine/threonine-protein kinase HipA
MSGYEDFPHIGKLKVAMDLAGEVVPVGTLARSADDRRIYFEYDKDFIDRKLEVSPFELDLKRGARAPKDDTPFDGLFGLFDDSLPDGWGRRLLDWRLKDRNINSGDLTALDRLSFVGITGMGALTYEPVEVFETTESGRLDLDALSAEAERVQEEFGEADVDKLQDLQGSAGGARPKIMIGRNAATGALVEDFGKGLPDGFEPWIAKFRSKMNDHAHIGAEEYAYSLMAKACGIDMPETALLKGDKGNYFAVKRFDRTAAGRVHVHTACGLLHASHRYPSINYTDLLKVAMLLTRDKTHVEQMFRRMIFNVLARNRDDHTKNHAFQMSPIGLWTPTPAYDLTLSSGMNGEHSLAIAREGAKPVWRHVAEEAKLASISVADAEAMFQEVEAAVEKWPAYAEQAGLPEKRTEEVDYLLNARGPKPKEEVEVSIAPSSP